MKYWLSESFNFLLAVVLGDVDLSRSSRGDMWWMLMVVVRGGLSLLFSRPSRFSCSSNCFLRAEFASMLCSNCTLRLRISERNSLRSNDSCETSSVWAVLPLCSFSYKFNSDFNVSTSWLLSFNCSSRLAHFDSALNYTTELNKYIQALNLQQTFEKDLCSSLLPFVAFCTPWCHPGVGAMLPLSVGLEYSVNLPKKVKFKL